MEMVAEATAPPHFFYIAAVFFILYTNRCSLCKENFLSEFPCILFFLNSLSGI